MGSNDERPSVWTGHVVAHSADPAAAAAFYEAIGMRPVAVLPDFAVLELRGGTHLVIRRAEDHVGTELGWDLMVDDLAATHRAWTAAGHDVSAIERDRDPRDVRGPRSGRQHDHRLQLARGRAGLTTPITTRTSGGEALGGCRCS